MCDYIETEFDRLYKASVKAKRWWREHRIIKKKKNGQKRGIQKVI